MGDWSVGHKPRHPGHENGQWYDHRDSSGRLQQRRSQSARGATERFLPPAVPSPSTSRLTAPASRASALSGHLGETVEVVVTNGYAAVQIDKTTSSATVVPGGQITYTLQATNTGGLTLNPVVVSDRLPSMMELVSASVAGGAGECHLTETTRPQLLTCTMSGSLAPGAVTSLITLVVNVDSTVAVGSTIVNQAMVHGAYAADAVLSGLGKRLRAQLPASCVRNGLRPLCRCPAPGPAPQRDAGLRRARRSTGLQTSAVQAFGSHHGTKVDRSVDVGERFGRTGQLFVDQRRGQELLVDLQQDEI